MDFADIALKLALSLAVVVVALIAYRILYNRIRRRVEDATRRQAMRVFARNALAITSFLIIVVIWLARRRIIFAFLPFIRPP